jgi:hypothetical protein
LKPVLAIAALVAGAALAPSASGASNQPPPRGPLGAVKVTIGGPARERSSYLPVGPGRGRDHIPSSVPRPAPATVIVRSSSAASLSIFDQPALPVRSVPTSLRDGSFCPIDPTSVHLLAVTPSKKRIYLARGPKDSLTWVILDARGPGGGGGCSAASEVRARGAVVLAPEEGPATVRGGGLRAARRPPPPRYVVGFALDGYTSASGGGKRVPIVQNVFVIDHAGPIRTVSVSGPAGHKSVRLR